MQVGLSFRRSTPKTTALSPEPLSWELFLQTLGYEEQREGWTLELASTNEQLLRLREFLENTSPQSREEAVADISSSILQELERFARGLAHDPPAARFSFTLEAAKLENLYRLALNEELAEWVEEALLGFDLQVESRQKALKHRLDWKPEKPQKRVDQNLNSHRYQPGAPNWLTGQLNDAPALLGQKLSSEKAKKWILELESTLYKVRDGSAPVRSSQAEVTLRNTFFAQGREPRVQFGKLREAPGVEGYLLNPPSEGPKVLEFPREDGSFVYLMFDGHHRAAAQVLQGDREFQQAKVMHLDETEKHGYTDQDILEAIRDLHTHLYFTEAPVPR